jgi:hypothetical protein
MPGFFQLNDFIATPRQQSSRGAAAGSAADHQDIALMIVRDAGLLAIHARLPIMQLVSGVIETT